MLTGTLATLLVLQIMALPDTVGGPATIYAPVIEHLRNNAPAPPGLPVVLDAHVYLGITGGVRRSHPAEVSRRLRAGGCIHAVCDRTAGSFGCPVPGEKYMSVGLGEVIHLPDSARVKVVPTGTDTDARIDQLLASVPDSMAVPVDAAVDVILGRPCPAPPESERCRVPDVVMFRYFLRIDHEGKAHVVTRWFSGAV